MAIPFLNNINLSDNQLQNAKLHITGTAPTAAAAQIYFDSSDTIAKYYSNATDTWVSLVQTDFANGTFVSLTNGGTSIKRSYTVDLSAVDGTSTSASRFLTKDNTWATIPFGDVTEVQGGTNINVTDQTGPIPIVNLDDSIDLAGELTVSGTGQSSVAGQLTIPQVPSADTDAASKHYVDQAVTGALSYQGGYDAATNTPDLDSSPSSAIKTGWTYTVTVDGLFFTEQVRVGDVLIANNNAPTTLAEWTTVQNNIDLADLTTVGIGNVNAGTGISVAYVSGTATVTNTDTNSSNTYAVTITDTATITHSLGTKDVIIQLYDVTTDETVYADVERGSTSEATITFAATPTNSVRVLVQKIG